MISTVEYAADLVLSAPEARAVRLARELARQDPGECRELPSELRTAAREFAGGYRRHGFTPEAMVIAIKNVFQRLDHRVPSLADPMWIRHAPEQRPPYAECYGDLLSVCIKSYFE